MLPSSPSRPRHSGGGLGRGFFGQLAIYRSLNRIRIFQNLIIAEADDPDARSTQHFTATLIVRLALGVVVLPTVRLHA